MERVAAEIRRLRAMTVRDATKRFQHQMHVGRLERLARFLDSGEMSGEITPSERAVYTSLAPPAAAPVAAVAPAPVAAPAAPAPAGAVEAPEAEHVPTGKERRTSRRIQMKTRARIRRDSDQLEELVDPTNVSKGGIGFQSPKRFALHEIVWVMMHYRDGTSGEMETRSMIVRAAPMERSIEFSYGVKFLE